MRTCDSPAWTSRRLKTHHSKSVLIRHSPHSTLASHEIPDTLSFDNYALYFVLRYLGLGLSAQRDRDHDGRSGLRRILMPWESNR